MQVTCALSFEPEQDRCAVSSPLGAAHLLFQLFQALAALGAEALAGDDDHLGMMRQAVEPGRGEQRIAKEVGPLGGCAVAGEHDAALLVALVDDVVEVFRAGRGERLEPEVVQ